jgi:hypothetical protein
MTCSDNPGQRRQSAQQTKKISHLMYLAIYWRATQDKTAK